jgi:hypothetical protein
MSLMSFIYKMMLFLYQSGVISGYISNIYWHASKFNGLSSLFRIYSVHQIVSSFSHALWVF